MNVELQINNSVNPTARFVSWAPSPCRIRVTDPSGATAPLVNVQITGASAASAGAVVFRGNTTGPFSNSLTVPVPITGASVPFFVAGAFGRPSVNNGDVRIEARNGTTLVGSVQVMVRVRKNANALTPGERDRFVAAFAQLNNQGAGRFVDFRDMHTAVSSIRRPTEHRGFCPGTALTCSISNVSFRRSTRASHCLTGASTSPRRTSLHATSSASPIAIGTVQFSATNPLQFWTTDGVQGINRRPFFNTAAAPPGLRTEAQTLAPWQSVPSVPELWKVTRTDQRTPASAVPSPASRPPREIRCSSCFTATSIDSGRSGSDRMAASIRRRRPRTTAIPGIRSAITCLTRCGRGMGSPERPRPPTAPGGAMAASPCVSAPGPQPRVRDCLDYQGSVNAVSRMGFDYDDVPFA